MNKLLCLLTALVAPFAVHADERFIPYIEWIVANSDLEYNGEPLPTIEVMPYPWLEVTVYGPENVAMAERNNATLPEVRGAYDHERNVLMFPDHTDPWDVEDVMVHELVHYLQYLDDVPECTRKLERPAYELHWQWVEEHGYDAIEPNWLFVYLIEQSCYEYHPDYAR